MTEPNPLDPTRVGLIRDRLGELLASLPCAFNCYDTAVQHVTRETWWSEKTQTANSPEQLAFLARKYWPGQPLTGKLGEYYTICIAAARVAERPSVRDSWHKHTKHAQTFLGHTKSSEDVLPVIRSAFDDKRQEAAKLLERAAAMIRSAGELLEEAEKDRDRAIEVSGLGGIATGTPERLAPLVDAALSALATLSESLWEKTDDGLPLPRSVGQWRMFETNMAASLLELGLSSKRVTEIFSSADDSADPEDERARVAKNVRRAKKR